MANLNTLYREAGLPGILPYVWSEQGKRFLCDLLTTEEFHAWIMIEQVSGIPFVFADDDRVYFRLFSAYDKALECEQALVGEGFTAWAVLLTPGSSGIKAFWARCRELGASHIRFDDDVWLSLSDLTPPADCDGFIDTERPLKNAQLNAALYCAVQFMRAERDNVPLSAYFWDIFRRSRLYVPRIADAGDDVKLYCAALEDGREGFLAFTDDGFLAAYMEHDPQENMEVYIPDYAALLEYMTAHPETPMVLNRGAGDFVLGMEQIGELDQMLLSEEAAGWL